MNTLGLLLVGRRITALSSILQAAYIIHAQKLHLGQNMFLDLYLLNFELYGDTLAYIFDLAFINLYLAKI